jgi:hypothetical protein
VGVDAETAERLKVLKDALNTSDGVLRSFYMNSVRAEIDPDAERILH